MCFPVEVFEVAFWHAKAWRGEESRDWECFVDAEYVDGKLLVVNFIRIICFWLLKWG